LNRIFYLRSFLAPGKTRLTITLKLKRKNIKYFLSLIIIFFAFAIVFFIPIIPYSPIVSDLGREIKLVANNELITKDHLDRAEHVFKYYGENYWRVSSNTLFICIPLKLDKELIWNYTIKAEDPNWLKEHKN